MPRKPTSVFVIVEPANAAVAAAQNNGLRVWRVPYSEDASPAEMLAAATQTAWPAGTAFYLVDDARVTKHRVELQVADVDDPRLGVEEDE